ncbi:MAG: beta-ketoacyl-ACP synthase III [Bdellovibrionota bacterium]
MSTPLTYASRMTGIGSAFPERVVKNDDLKQYMETSDDWIRERTGMRERRAARKGDPKEFNSALATQASLRALEMAGKKPEDIDAILFGTCSPDTPLPSTACWLQLKLGAKNAWAVDLNAACSGFVYALSTADAYIRSGKAKTVLVVGSEVLTTTMLDWTDRGTGILFGDGSGAAILERTTSDEKRRIYSTHLGSDGNLWEMFHVPAGGSNMEVTPEAHAQKLDKMKMKGKEIYREAVRTLVDYADKALTANGMTAKDVDWVVPHQANLRILEAVAKRLEIPMDKFVINLDRYGNTSAATVPTALDEAVRDGRIKPGHVVLLDVFGAGLTYGSALMRW